MPQRIKILLFVFLLTGAAAAFTLWSNTRSNTFTGQVSEVGIKDSTWIEEVNIKKPTGEMLSLTQKDNNWEVNGKYEAREQLITLFFFGISRMEVKRPVSETSKNKVLKDLKEKGIKITLKGDNKEKTFYALTNENDVNSNYYVNEGSNDAFIVEVPGVKGNITNLANLGEEDWRSRDVFASNFRTIQEISVEYPAEKKQNFQIVFEDRNLRVKGLENQDSMKVMQYVQLIETFSADKFVTKSKDSILQVLKKEVPGVVIRVKDINDKRSENLSIYVPKSFKGKVFGVLGSKNELVTLNPKIVQYLLVNQNFFAKKEDKSETY